MKTKILTILLFTLLLTPAYAEDTQTGSEPPAEGEKQEIPFKEPFSSRKMIMKFLYAMGGVTISSLTLFVGLSLYNKIRNNVIKTANSDYANTLNTPNNFKDSINIYLEKTKD